jgi:potassium efflux system protein
MKKPLLLFSLFIACSVFVLCFPPPSSDAKESPAKPEVAEEEPEQAALNRLYSWSTIFPRELIELQNRLNSDDTLKQVVKDLPEIRKEVEALKWNVTVLKTTPNLNVQQVSLFVAKYQKLDSRLQRYVNTISASIGFFSEQRKTWHEREQQISEIGGQEDISFPLALEMYENLSKTVDEALEPLENQLKLALTVGKTVADLQVVLVTLNSDLKVLENELKSTSMYQTAPSIFSREFYSRIEGKVIVRSYKKTVDSLTGLLESLYSNKLPVALSIFVLGLISFIVFKSRKNAPRGFRWYPFASHPVATSVFIVSSVNAALGMLSFSSELPQQWELLLRILTLLAVVRLTKHLIPNPSDRGLIVGLTSFLAVAMVLFLFGLDHIIIFLYVFCVAVFFLVYYFRYIFATRGLMDNGVWLRRLWGILPAVVIVLGLTGYDQLSLLAFSIFLGTIIAILIIWILYLLHLGILEQLLLILPFSLLRENATVIVKNLKPFIALLHILLLIAVELVVWNFYPTVHSALSAIANAGLDIFGFRLTPGFVFAVIFVIYWAVQASRAVESVLLNRVLPRYRVEKGVQLSITRLINYAIIFIGFCILLRVLGFELNQLAILGGALGVGIGFGLQAIVNNFVSGLILLFERPIKVGDTIQLGTEFGEVKSLGLRATIVQTFDNAEIVVPNSDLITAQVTNWTLANRKVRVKVPVGVAYGTDVTKVIDILLGCAKENPMVLTTPKPVALFLAFGASSLDFELRLWIPEFLDKLQVLSDLNQDIENEFALNGIEIPFPQSDIHLRSVDKGVVLNLSGDREVLDGGQQ